MKSFKINQSVQWKWLGRRIAGQVQEIYFESVTKLIKNKRIKRNGSIENPAYLVKSKAGNLALKLHSELQPFVGQEFHYKSLPTMFGDD